MRVRAAVFVAVFAVALAAVSARQGTGGSDGKWAATAARLSRERLEQSPGWKIATDRELFGDAFVDEIAAAARQFTGQRFEKGVPAGHRPSLAAIQKKNGVGGVGTGQRFSVVSWNVEALGQHVYFYFYGRFGFGVSRYNAADDPYNKVIWVVIDGPGSWGIAVDEYRARLQELQSSSATVSVESVFASARRVDDALHADFDSSGTVLEWLSQADYDRLVSDLLGLSVNRNEIVFVKPDPAYFVRLSQQHGRPVDTAFFAEYALTYPEPPWMPSYIKQQTDYSGCVIYGQGELVRRYGAWQRFRQMFPGHYEISVTAVLKDIEETVGESTCACEDKTEVTRELSAFLEAFSASPAAEKVRQRLADIKAGRSSIRFKCKSG